MRRLWIVVVPFVLTLVVLSDVRDAHADPRVRSAATTDPGNVYGDQGNGTVNGTDQSGPGGSNSNGPGIPTAGTCAHCIYSWVDACDPALDQSCGTLAPCPPGFTMQTLLIVDPVTKIVRIGTTQCRGPRGGPTPAQVQQAVTDRFSQLLTTARPSFRATKRRTGELANAVRCEHSANGDVQRDTAWPAGRPQCRRNVDLGLR
jgi:hypothetical protein